MLKLKKKIDSMKNRKHLKLTKFAKKKNKKTGILVMREDL